MIGGLKNIGIADQQKRAHRRRVNEFALRFEHDDARRFRTNQRACDVESVLGQQLIEIEAGDAARDLRIARANEIGVAIANRFQARVNLAATSAFRDDSRELFFRGFADGHAHAVVREDVELLDVVDGFAGHQRVNAARVVADHSADRAVRVRRGIGTEGELVVLGGVAEIVEDDAGLHARVFRVGIELDDLVQVLRKVHDDGDVAALAGE